MLATFAQFERNMIGERQAEGIAKAKVVYSQRKRTLYPEKVKQLFEYGMSKAAIALSYQNLKFEPKSVIKLFLSFVIIIHKNCMNAKKAMIVNTKVQHHAYNNHLKASHGHLFAFCFC